MKHVFERRSFIAARAEHVMAYHAAADALTKLLPPLVFVQVLRDQRLGLTHGEFEFRAWLGPLPLHWVVRHEAGPIETAFADRTLRGPFAMWLHEHIFQPVEGGTELIDRITYAHKPGIRGWLTRMLFNGLALRLGFGYRHWRTRRDVEGLEKDNDDVAGG